MLHRAGYQTKDATAAGGKVVLGPVHETFLDLLDNEIVPKLAPADRKALDHTHASEWAALLSQEAAPTMTYGSGSVASLAKPDEFKSTAGNEGAVFNLFSRCCCSDPKLWLCGCR